MTEEEAQELADSLTQAWQDEKVTEEMEPVKVVTSKFGGPKAMPAHRGGDSKRLKGEKAEKKEKKHKENKEKKQGKDKDIIANDGDTPKSGGMST